MVKFLERNYPMSRVKDKQSKRFKRGIILDGGETFHLSNDVEFLLLQQKLFEILIKVFSCDEKASYSVLKDFLHLKK